MKRSAAWLRSAARYRVLVSHSSIAPGTVIHSGMRSRLRVGSTFLEGDRLLIQNGKNRIRGGKVAMVESWGGTLLNSPEPAQPEHEQHETSDVMLPADPSQRMAAHLIDDVLVIGVYGGIWAAIFLLSGRLVVSSLGLVCLILFYVCANLYWAILDGRGQTIGKRVCGIRLVDSDSYEPVGFWKALGRNTLGSFISGQAHDLGYLWMFWDRNRQSWGDMAFHTLVVTGSKPLNEEGTKVIVNRR